VHDERAKEQGPMNYNPYAAPQAGPAATPGPAGYLGSPQPWDAGEVLGAAFEAFKNNAGLLIGATVLFVLCLMPLSILPSVLTFSHAIDPASAPYFIVAFGCQAGTILIDAFVSVGLIRILLAVARGQQASVGDVFSGASHFIPMFVVIFLTRVIEIVGCCSVGLIPVYMGLCFASYFVVDQNLGPIEAFSAAWRSTEGQRGDVLVYSLLALLVYMAGAVLCGVGMLATAPIAMLGFAIIYLRITGGGGAPRPGGFAPPAPPTGFGPPPGGGPGYGPPGGGPGYGGPGYGGPGYGGPQGGGYGPPGGYGPR
jgi:hypothetical protein